MMRKPKWLRDMWFNTENKSRMESRIKNLKKWGYKVKKVAFRPAGKLTGWWLYKARV